MSTWLATLCAMILSLVVLGGITRATHSGLSIVQWKPMTGALPPLTRAAWERAFQDYQRFPEFRLINPRMTLEGFQSIYLWEYLHRLLARLIGLVLLIPGWIFWRKGKLDPKLARMLVFGLALGAIQGGAGWLMVQSGLVDRPSVSHFRLAIHLGLGLALLSYFFWMFLDSCGPSAVSEARARAERGKWIVGAFLGLLSLQIVYGALTAGLKAGLIFNTFPQMNGEWVPAGSFLETPAVVQWTHRFLGCALVLLCGFVARISTRGKLLACAVMGQFALGVATLLAGVPLRLAVSHQLGACVVLLLAIATLHQVLGAPGRPEVLSRA